MGVISDALKRPSGVEEWTYPLISFDDYSMEDQREFHREHPQTIVWMRDKHPDAFENFVNKFGQAFADEVIALAN